MKKLLFLILFISAINEIKAENKVEIIDYVGTELQFIINRSTENNQFSKYYSLQYHGTTTTEFLTTLHNFTLNSVSATHISITADNGQTIVFSIESENSGANVLGYGFGERHGAFALNTSESEPFIWDLAAQVKKNPKPKDFDCDSGGEGSNQCSVDGGIASVSTGCSVKCNMGYYACCDAGKTECKCFNGLTREIDIHYQQPVRLILYTANPGN